MNKSLFLIFFIAVLPSFAQEEPAAQTAATFQETLNFFDERDRWKVRRFISEGSHEKELPVEQLLEMNDNEKTALKMFLAMDDTEKETIKVLFENENKYYLARRRKRNGLIVSGVGAAVSVGGAGLLGLTAIYSYHRESHNPFAMLGLLTSTIVIFSGATVSTVGIPITIAGAVNMHKYEKYKPTLSISPNEVKFSINF